MLKGGYVYILQCADGSFYTGSAPDLTKRLEEHQSRVYGDYTHLRRPIRLVFSQEFPDWPSTVAAERQIKGWTRAKKIALIQGRYDLLKELSRCTNATASLRRNKS